MGLMNFAAGKAPISVTGVTEELTESGVAVSSRCAFMGLLVATDGTNNITINVYDNATAASGTKLLPTDTVFLASGRLQAVGLLKGIAAQNGLYVEITCAGDAKVMVLYDN